MYDPLTIANLGLYALTGGLFLFSALNPSWVDIKLTVDSKKYDIDFSLTGVCVESENKVECSSYDDIIASNYGYRNAVTTLSIGKNFF